MTETDPDRLADELERDADELEQRSGEVHDKIDHARTDWARKRNDPSVPGALPDTGDDEQAPEHDRDPSAG